MQHIFVFGSNLAGIHGAGSAKEAFRLYGAVWGQGVGIAGNSYAIPTKDQHIKSMTLEQIEPYIKDFIEFAKANPSYRFNIVDIGCGLAGFKPEDIAPLFEGAPGNCHFLGKLKELVF